jgi:DNA invertase Pin-like site-specific DNA recombinase
MIHVAYSYLRFSTPEQAAGDSRRRQIAMAEKYAADHHLKLDLHLSFRDLGVSAYRGRTAKEGALRAFLDAIEHNLGFCRKFAGGWARSRNAVWAYPASE